MKRVRPIFYTVVMVVLLFATTVYGDTWTANRRLTKNTGDSEVPVIAVVQSNIYVVWSDDTAGNYEIFFKRSIDGGATWTANRRLTNTAGGSFRPAIAVDGPNISVVWHDYTPGNAEIFFKRSNDGGVKWSASQQLTNNTGDSEDSAIAVDGPNISVVWQDYTPGNAEIFFKRSNDGGVKWSASKRLTNNTGGSEDPAIAVAGSNIYVVWSDDTPGNKEIFFKRSNDGGAIWTANRRVTKNTGHSELPAIAMDGSNISVVWMDDTPGNREIYFKQSIDGGVVWAANRRLTNNTGESFAPAIAVDGSNIYVSWDDDTPGNSEIYFKRSVNRGVNWTAARRLTNNTGDSWNSALAVDGPNIYVAWEDNTPGNREIYFRNGQTKNTGQINGIILLLNGAPL
jgi:WD40-like Beta Propeller Repeat